jgi:hypothetical protein
MGPAIKVPASPQLKKNVAMMKERGISYGLTGSISVLSTGQSAFLEMN